VNHDSVIASMPDGTSAALYRRDPAKYRALLAEALQLHKRMWTEWPQYAKLYRDKLGEITSPETWEKTFAPWAATPFESAPEPAHDGPPPSRDSKPVARKSAGQKKTPTRRTPAPPEKVPEIVEASTDG
jgi:Galactofuranosyltransferase-2, domain 3